VPGLAIKTCIRQLSLPRVSQVAWNGAAASVDWYDPKRREGEHYSIYGIEMNYDNGRARVYVIDTGTGAVHWRPISGRMQRPPLRSLHERLFGRGASA